MQVFNVKIYLYPRKGDYGRGCRTFVKPILADTEEQARRDAEQLFDGFLAAGVTIETKIKKEKA